MNSFLKIWTMSMLLMALMVGCGGEDETSGADGDTDTDSDSYSDSDPDCAAPEAAQCGGGWGVFDSGSCRCWEIPGSTAEYTWEEAVAYCDNLTLGGFSDWVLASRYDYQDMLGGCDEQIALDAMGYCQTCDDSPSCSAIIGDGELVFWTSTTASTGNAWYVAPYGGLVRAGGVNSTELARCVRASQ